MNMAMLPFLLALVRLLLFDWIGSVPLGAVSLQSNVAISLSKSAQNGFRGCQKAVKALAALIAISGLRLDVQGVRIEATDSTPFEKRAGSSRAINIFRPETGQW
jgi:hypothetical protein